MNIKHRTPSLCVVRCYIAYLTFIISSGLVVLDPCGCDVCKIYRVALLVLVTMKPICFSQNGSILVLAVVSFDNTSPGPTYGMLLQLDYTIF